MTDTQKRYLRKTVLWSLMLNLIVVVVAVTLIGTPERLSYQDSFKPPSISIGVPPVHSLVRSLNLSTEQVEHLGNAGLALGLGMTLLFVIGNVLYVALLARSVRDLADRPTARLVNYTITLIGWTIVQTVVGMLLFPIATMLEAVGLVLSTVLILWFRYVLIFFEFAVITDNRRFVAAWVESLRMRKLVPLQDTLIPFIAILMLTSAFAFVINAFFSWPMLIVTGLLYLLAMTWAQHRLMKSFFVAQDRLAEQPVVTVAA